MVLSAPAGEQYFERHAPRRIAVFRPLHLGDLLCSVPAFRALRRAAPHAEIVLIGLPWAQSFVARYPAYIDRLMEFPGYPGFVEREATAEALEGFVAQARAQAFDLAIQLHGTGYDINDIVLRLGAARVAGFHPPEESAPTPYFIPWPDDVHEIHRYTKLTQHLGAADAGDALEFPLTDRDRAEATAFAEAHGLLPRGYLCLHVGSKLRSRRWPLERFAQVAEALSGDGWRIVLTGTTGEAPLAAHLRGLLSRQADARMVDALGKTSLGGLAALVASARLAISNDTGLVHVATAVGAPTVIVSSGGDVARWAPLDAARHRVLWHDVPCRPCGHDVCPVGHPCARGVPADAVLAAARAALRSASAPSPAANPNRSLEVHAS